MEVGFMIRFLLAFSVTPIVVGLVLRSFTSPTTPPSMYVQPTHVRVINPEKEQVA